MYISLTHFYTFSGWLTVSGRAESDGGKAERALALEAAEEAPRLPHTEARQAAEGGAGEEGNGEGGEGPEGNTQARAEICCRH